MNISGGNNVFVGHTAGFNTDAKGNVFVGEGAGITNTTGTLNTTLGTNADVLVNNLINAAAIGSSAIVTTDNSMILGDNNVNVGIGLSNEPTGVLNKLEINAINAGSPNNIDDTAPNGCGGSSSGESGLSFRDLTSNSIPCPSNNLGLSVDGSGKVILVPAGAGGVCGTSPVGLPNSWEMPLNGFNYIFSDVGTDLTRERVGIGRLPFACRPFAKLHVVNDASPNVAINAGLFVNNGTNPLLAGQITAVVGSCNVITNATNIGGGFSALNSSTTNMGVLGISNGVIGTSNIGVQAVAANSVGPNVGIMATAPIAPGNWAGLFNGDMNVNGTCFNTTGGVWLVSDQIFKTNIVSTSNNLSLLKQLHPKSYDFDTTNVYGMNFSSKHQLGFLAQEVEQIVPDLVNTFTKPADLDSTGNVIHQSITYKALTTLNLFLF